MGTSVRYSFLVAAVLSVAGGTTRAGALQVAVPQLSPGASWTVISIVDPAQLPQLGGTSRVFWDLRPPKDAGPLVRFTVAEPVDAGLGPLARDLGADRAVCAHDVGADRRMGCRLVTVAETRPSGMIVRWSDIPGDVAPAAELLSTLAAGTPIEMGLAYEETVQDAEGAVSTTRIRAIAEGVALLPAGPREVVLLEEIVRGLAQPVLRYRFLTRAGESAAVLEGPLPPPGEPFAPERGELLVIPAANDGIQIPYPKLSQALAPGTIGFLQYSQENPTALSAIHPAWSGVPEMISIDAAGVSYQPDPSDPGTLQTLPEVWDFTGLQSGMLTFRTFNTTRDDLAGNLCAESCAQRNVGPNPPDGTWQAYLKIDNYDRAGAFYTRDIFDINNNDTGANPAIDVAFVAQNELDVNQGRTQICFAQSAGGAERMLHFFRFLGANPASAVLGVGDSWTSGAWTECDNANGLRLTATALCPSACYPECGGVNPRARGLLGGGAGFRSTIVEDGWVHLPTGNYVRALLMRQDTDIEAGVDFFGVCNISPTRRRAFDYFWVHEDFGLLALVSSPADTTITATNWSAVGNTTDGADFTWGPLPPHQSQADACLAGTRISWALPTYGSNLAADPGLSDYGYVVSWGSQTDPAVLADWNANPNHTPLPGSAGYLAAPAGGEPTSTVITGWPGASINATVAMALRYTDPDVGDLRTYRSPAFYKVTANPAKLTPAAFQVGNSVAPFVSKSGANLTLAWPAVAGATSYRLRVFDLDAKVEIPCPAGLDCSPAAPAATHLGGAASAANYGYRAFAVDPCAEVSAN